MNLQRFTAVIEREGDGYVSLCPEFDIASQGRNGRRSKGESGRSNRTFLETADETEIENRLHTEIFITQLEVAVG